MSSQYSPRFPLHDTVFNSGHILTFAITVLSVLLTMIAVLSLLLTKMTPAETSTASVFAVIFGLFATVSSIVLITYVARSYRDWKIEIS